MASLEGAQSMYASQSYLPLCRRYLAANTVSAQDVLVVEIGAQLPHHPIAAGLPLYVPCQKLRSCPDGISLACAQA